jgi:hypothetical protein
MDWGWCISSPLAYPPVLKFVISFGNFDLKIEPEPGLALKIWVQFGGLEMLQPQAAVNGGVIMKK